MHVFSRGETSQARSLSASCACLHGAFGVLIPSRRQQRAQRGSFIRGLSSHRSGTIQSPDLPASSASPCPPQTTSYAPIPSSSSSSYGPLAAPYVPPSSYAPSSSSYGPSSSSYPGSSSYTPQSSGYGSGPPPSFGPTSVSSSYGPIASSSAYAQSLSATPYQPSYSDNSQANSYPSSSSSYEQQQQQHSSYGDFAPSAPTPHQH